ncbi:oligosaccharide flippase family protein [bacterium]|nr:oligosaccharide flippase family protein [bacterium]
MVPVQRPLISSDDESRQMSGGLAFRIARNSTVILSAKIIEISASLIVLMMLSRMLGMSRFGDFAFINAVILAFQPLVNLELNTILIREMARNRDCEKAYLGGGLLLKLFLIGLFVIAAVVLDFSMGFAPLLRIAFYLAVAGEIFQQLTWVFSAVFMARERMEFEPLLSLIFRVTSVGGIALVAFFHPRETMATSGFVMVFLILAASQGLRALAGMLIASQLLKGLRIQWSLTVAKKIIQQSWIMGVATFCTGLSLRVDVFFLRYFKGSDCVALFHLPHMFTLQVQILAISLVTALFPVFSRWGTDKLEAHRFRQAQDISIRIMTSFGLFITLVTVLYPNWIIRLLGGTTYLEASTALTILAWCIPVLFLNYLGANLLTAIKKQHYLIYGATFSLVLNVVLDFLWIPKYDILGASIATVISYSLQLLIVLALLRKYTGNSLHFAKALCLPWAICLTGAALGWFVEGSLVVVSAIGIIFRLGILIIVGGLLWILQPTEVKQMIAQSRKTLKGKIM